MKRLSKVQGLRHPHNNHKHLSSTPKQPVMGESTEDEVFVRYLQQHGGFATFEYNQKEKDMLEFIAIQPDLAVLDIIRNKEDGWLELQNRIIDRYGYDKGWALIYGNTSFQTDYDQDNQLTEEDLDAAPTHQAKIPDFTGRQNELYTITFPKNASTTGPLLY